MCANVMRWLGVCCALFLGAAALRAAEDDGAVRGLQPGAIDTPAPTAGATPASPVAAHGAWTLEMGLSSAQVAINQPVMFRVQSNREIHFSVLGIAADGAAQQLVPRPGAAPLVLAAGTAHELPRDYDLRVPAPGTERLYLVASTRPLAAITPAGKAAVTPTDPALPLPEDATLVVRELLLQVVDPSAAAAAPVPAASAAAPAAPAAGAASGLPVLVFDAPRRMYRIGESVEIQYGASRDGWLHLFLQIGGELNPLGVKAVQADRFQLLRATATAPPGEQTLVALWSATEALDATARATLERRLRKTLASGEATRALTLVVDVPIAYRTIPLLINP